MKYVEIWNLINFIMVVSIILWFLHLIIKYC